jgi:hypothetical protein
MQTEIVKLTERRSVAVYSTDDVEPVLEHNKLLRTMEQPNTDGLKHIASVPNIIMVKWLNEEWQRGNSVRYLSREWDELVTKKLKDPEWAYLRTDGPAHRVGWGA